MDSAVIIAAISAGATVAVGVYAARVGRRAGEATARAAEHAARIEDRKADHSAVVDAVNFYKDTLKTVTDHMGLLNSQVKDLRAQLGEEQDVSNKLRNQVRNLSQQVSELMAFIESRGFEISAAFSGTPPQRP